MLTKTVKAATTTTDLGEFTAIAAAYSVDRVNDRIVPGAFGDTIKAWQESGKMIPVHWDHGGEPDDIIGYVDPAQMSETDAGLRVRGQLDLEGSAKAQDAWRAMKENSIGMSFGYLVNDQVEGPDGVNELKNLDLFELTLTPAPVQPDTRVLEMKSAQEVETLPPPAVEEGDEDEAEEDGEEEVAQDKVKATPTDQGYDAVAYRLATRGIDGKKIEQPPAEEPVVIPADEIEGAKGGELKAVWTAAYVNDLPDSAFLHIEAGGQKDADGKTTPRNLRHFPVKDASGAVDLPHLRNALSRIPQSNLSQDVKDRLTAKAQAMLDNATKAIKDAPSQEPSPATEQASDSLSEGYEAIAFRMATRGIDLKVKSPRVEEPEGPSLDELTRDHDALMFRLLTSQGGSE